MFEVTQNRKIHTGGSTLVLQSSTDQLAVTSSPTDKGSMLRTNGGKPGVRDRPLCVTAGPWSLPVTVALSQLLQVSQLKQGWRVYVETGDPQKQPH